MQYNKSQRITKKQKKKKGMVIANWRYLGQSIVHLILFIYLSIYSSYLIILGCWTAGMWIEVR